jgi:hypothetical protein
MIAAVEETRPWTRGRWWAVISLIFLAQVGIIFWLGDKRPVAPRAAAPAPEIRLGGEQNAELLALEDPTLFALPSRRGFSGRAWLLTAPSTNFFRFEALPFFLTSGSPQFTAIFAAALETNAPGTLESAARTTPAFGIAAPQRPAAEACRSDVWLEGGLASRRLRTPMTLAPQAANDVLANTEVQVVVNERGQVMSIPLLLQKSGSPAADNEALERAGNARFDALPATKGSGAAPEQLTWGKMVFQWCTVPKPATNDAANP